MGVKVYVGNLSSQTTDEDLRSEFSNYGDLQDTIVMRDRDTGDSRGFGYVTFGEVGGAEAAIQAMNGGELDGQKIEVKFANAR